jgi:RNA-directed DNA polymerase
MALWPPHLYRSQGSLENCDPVVVENSLNQAHRVQSNDRLPAILTLRHLAMLCDASYATLRSLVSRTHSQPYRFFRARKRSGGYRLICVPCRPLFMCQQFLAHHVLSRLEAHPSSMAYGRGQSIKKCAQLHCGSRWLIKIDVQQFFESISERQAYRVFLEAGYNSLISFELARLCTRTPDNAPSRYKKRRWRNDKPLDAYSIEEYWTPRVGHLPQGAPTSPMLSSVAMRPLDDSLSRMAQSRQLHYSRYADDIIFSSASGSFDRECAMQLVKSTFDELRRVGLRPNTTKTTISPPGARKIVLGLTVDGNVPRLRRDFKLRLEQHIYFLAKYGPASHAEKRGFKSIFSLRRHVLGLLSHARHIEPNFAAPLAEKLKEVHWPFAP